MLRSYKELSGRYLRHNKKRTLLTLLGIILSMALISTIGLFIIGAEASQIQQTKKNSGMGAHIVFFEMDDLLFSKVENNPNVQSYGFMKRDSMVQYGQISFQKYRVDDQAAEYLGYAVKEGRMPETSNELCVDEWIKVYLGTELKLGDSIELDGQTYQIVGFLKNELNNQREKISRAVRYDSDLKDGQLLVEIRSGEMFSSTIETLKRLAPEDMVSVNNELVSIQKLESNQTILAAGVIVVGMVVLCTIIVIYNAFQISLVERTREFGLLRSIGATQKQIRSLVFCEASWMCILAVPIGGILSIGVIYLLQWILHLVMQDNQVLSVVCIDPLILLATALLTVFSVYVSSLAPARQIGNLSPMAAVNGASMIRKETVKKQKISSLIQSRNFKIGMALKNVWRNPKRCLVMILSITVSATLFITFTTLTQEVIQLKGTTAEYLNIDVEISLEPECWSKDQRETLAEDLAATRSEDTIYHAYEPIWGQLVVPVNKQIKAAGNIYEKDGGQSYLSAKVNFYDDSVLKLVKKYLTVGTCNADVMTQENGVILITNGNARDYTTKSRYFGQLTGYQVNDTVTIVDNSGVEHTMKIIGVIENELLDRNGSNNTQSFLSISSVLENLTHKVPEYRSLAVDLHNPESHFTAVQQVETLIFEYPSAYITDYVDLNNAARSSALLIQILVYGFIAVITLISTTNIVNTITMNITLRRKELSVLKSIGMSQRDLRKMILYEGLFYGLIGGAAGSVSGSILTYAIYDVLSDTIGLQWKAPLALSIWTILVAILISFLSVLLPLKKIQNDNMIEAIREG